MRNNVRGGDSLLSPALFAKTEKRTGGPAKGVPLFVYPKTKRAKKAAALALAVALWIAGGSVGEASFLFLDDAGQPYYLWGSKPEDATVTSDPATKTLNVVGGIWTDTGEWNIAGRYVNDFNSGVDVKGYTLNLSGNAILYNTPGTYPVCYGGKTFGYGTVSENNINIESGTLYGIEGGYSKGSSIKNIVTINGGSAFYVYGGRAEYNQEYGQGHATGNRVTINLHSRDSTLGTP